MTGSPGVAFLGDVGIALTAALAGGLIARSLKLPALIGYLVAGILIGPHTPGFIADKDTVALVADLGVALLMFAVGVQFSLEELRHVRRTALIGGASQLLGTILLGLGLGSLLGWGLYGGLFAGCALALSSTAVLLRLLDERGELGTTHGQLMLGLLVMQDLSLVLMVTLLPALAATSSLLPTLGLALLKALAFLGVIVLLALHVVPALLDRITRTGSRELLLLASVCLCLGIGFLADKAGLGLPLGTFLAGIVLSKSPYAHEVFSQIRPLRDVFSSLFFVSIGMLLDPSFVIKNLGPVLATVATILLGKTLVTALSLRWLGWSGPTALRVALGLAQIGEFSFVLATLGTSRGLIPPQVSGVLLAAALLTLLLAPATYASAAPLCRVGRHWPLFGRWLRAPQHAPEHLASPPISAPRVVVLGGGRVGRYVAEALRAHKIAHLVVEFDTSAAARLRAGGSAVLYGDATEEAVLRHAQLSQAEQVIFTLPEAASTELALRHVRPLAPQATLIVRVHRGEDIPRMRSAGATQVIHGEFEAGAEVIHQTLDRLQVENAQVKSYLQHIREQRYRQEADSPRQNH